MKMEFERRSRFAALAAALLLSGCGKSDSGLLKSGGERKPTAIAKTTIQNKGSDTNGA